MLATSNTTARIILERRIKKLGEFYKELKEQIKTIQNEVVV